MLLGLTLIAASVSILTKRDWLAEWLQRRALDHGASATLITKRWYVRFLGLVCGAMGVGALLLAVTH
jgi:hypothetical protein